MAAGGSGAWAEELVLGRGMNEAVCLQVSAGRDARMEDVRIGYMCQGKGGEYFCAVSAVLATCGNKLQCIMPAMFRKSELKIADA